MILKQTHEKRRYQTNIGSHQQLHDHHDRTITIISISIL